ncbi:MAG: RraA family protein [Acidobacteria bacterium]|nr:RraA family protein [Acidobacteriota bacterium]
MSSNPDPLAPLRKYNTPTIANAIELFDVRPRNRGFLKPGWQVMQPGLPPIAGYASTCLISGESPDSFGKKESFDYWEHIESIPGPRIAVVKDLDQQPGSACFWGEVNASVHMALGCVGTVTDGAIRDLDEMKSIGFQAAYRQTCVSHGYVHIVDFAKPVLIDGECIAPGDLLQLDQHGVLIVPPGILPHLQEAIDEIERRERPVIEYCQSGKATRQGMVEMVKKHLRVSGKWAPAQTY